MSDQPARARPWGVVAAVAMTVAVGGGGIGWWLSRPGPPAPPAVDLAGADREVADLVEASRRDVLASPGSARRWGHLGMVLRAHGYGGEANACFEQAERLDPADARWPYYRGLTLVLTDPAEGVACLSRAVERMGEGAVAPRLRLVEVLLEQGSLDEADRHLGRAAAAARDHPRGRMLRARLALARQDAKGALEALEECRRDVHTRRQAHHLAAAAWQRLGDAKRAREAEAEAARLPADQGWADPLVEEVERLITGARARLAQAEAMHQQGRSAEALQMLERLAADHPREVRVWISLGDVLQQASRLPAAEQAFQRAVEIEPTNVDGWFGLGVVRMTTSPRQAADAFRETIRHKADHVRAHYLLGVCLKNDGDLGRAREAFQQALRCDPGHGPATRAIAELDRDSRTKP